MLKRITFLCTLATIVIPAQAGFTDELGARYAAIKTAAINFKNSALEKPKINEYHKTKAFGWTAFGLLGLASARSIQIKLKRKIDEELRYQQTPLNKACAISLELINYSPFIAVGLHSAYKSFEKAYEHIKAARNA